MTKSKRHVKMHKIVKQYFDLRFHSDLINFSTLSWPSENTLGWCSARAGPRCPWVPPPTPPDGSTRSNPSGTSDWNVSELLFITKLKKEHMYKNTLTSSNLIFLVLINIAVKYVVTLWCDTFRKQMRVKGVGSVHLQFRVKFYVTDPSRIQEEYTRYHIYLQVNLVNYRWNEIKVGNFIWFLRGA